MLGLNIEVSSVCGVLAAMGILLPGNDIAASALVPLNEPKNKSIKRHSRNGVKVVLKTDDKDTDKSADKSADKDKISSKSVNTESGSISDSVDVTAAASSSSSSYVISNMSSNMVIGDAVSTVASSSSSLTVNKNDTASSVTEGQSETAAEKDKESVVIMDVVDDVTEDVEGADVTVRSNSAVVEMISEVSCSVDDAVVRSSSDSTTQIVCQGNHTDAISSKNSHDNSNNNNSSSSSSTGGVSGVVRGNDDCVSLLPHTHNESSSSVSATVSMDVVETPHHSSIFLHKTDLSSICTDTASDSSGAISERMEERSLSQSQNSVSELHDKMSSSELKDFGVLLSEGGVKEGSMKVEKAVTVAVTVAAEHVTIPTMTEDIKMDVENDIETETEVESDEENGNDSSDNAGEGVLEFLEKRWGDLLLNYLKEEEVRSKLRIQQENAFAAAASAAATAATVTTTTTAGAATAGVPTSFSRQISTDIIDVDDLKYMGGIPTNPIHSTVHTNTHSHGLENGNGNGSVGGGGVIDQNPDPLFEYSTTFSPTNDISNSLFLFAPGELEDAFPATPILTLSPIIINNMLTVANPVSNIPDITFPLLKGNSTADISYKAQNISTVQPVRTVNENEIVSVPFIRNKMDTENDGNTDEIKEIQIEQMIINEESNSSDENFSNLLQSTIVDTFLEKGDGNHFIPTSKDMPIFPSTFSTESGVGGEEKNEITDFECVFSTTPGSSFYEIDSKNMSIESKVQNEESYRDLISSFLPDNSESDNIEINNENGNNNYNNNNNNNNDMIINGNHNNNITSIIVSNIPKIISDSKIPCNTILKNCKNAAKRTSNQRLWKINPSLFPKQSKQFQTHTIKTNLINTNLTMTEFYNNGISSENGKISNGIKNETVHNKEESKNENVNDLSIKKEICTKSENIVSTYACVPAHSETVNGNLHINGNGNGNGNGAMTLIKKDVVMTIDGKNESGKIIVNSNHKKPSHSIKEKKKILKSSKELKKVLMEPENVLSAWMDACYEEACATELEESIIRRCVCVCVCV